MLGVGGGLRAGIGDVPLKVQALRVHTVHSFGPMPSSFDASFSISTVFSGSGRFRTLEDAWIDVTTAAEASASFFANTKNV